MRAFVTALGLALVVGGATAQAQYDPAASRAENQVNSLNRSMTTHQQDRAAAQQNQFETNSLRNELSRPVPPPLAPVSPPVINRR